MNLLDLFSGIGGFALGARWANVMFSQHFYSEVDHYASKVYSMRFPDAKPLGDITKIEWYDLTSVRGDWIITGGFPCQDISQAGRGAGIEGSRSGLWSEMFAAIRALRPRYAIIENVGAITFRGLDRVLADLAKIGYDAEWQDIRASDVGAPHRRERIWVVAYPNRVDMHLSERWPRPSNKEVYAGWDGAAQQVADPNSKRPSNWRQARCDAGKNEKVRQMALTKPQRRGSAWWETEPDVGRVANGVPSRVDRLKCLGNSIVPQIAEMIFKRLALDE